MKKLCLLLIFIWGVSEFSSYAGNNPDDEVQKAFGLRMNGKVDEAKALLEGILTKDSTNAMAWYELARIKHYMAVGSGKFDIEGVVNSINKAVNYDPTNVTYAYYQAVANFLNAFIAMQTGAGEVKNRIAQTCIQFEHVLKLKPDYHEATLYLVEIYGLLPRDMGGDSSLAVDYAWILGTKNKYFGAKAQSVLAPEGSDLVKYWEDLVAKNENNPEFLMEAGKACLFQDKIAQAENYFEKAIKADPAKNILILDLARYYMMKVMQSPDLGKNELPAAKIYLDRYLKTIPEPVIPLKAYTLGLLSIVERFMGNTEESDRLTKEATALDKYFSKASGIPTLLLFDPPDQISHHYFSFFSPF